MVDEAVLGGEDEAESAVFAVFAELALIDDAGGSVDADWSTDVFQGKKSAIL